MATGDQADFVGRLVRKMPSGWFPNNSAQTPNLTTILSGPAWTLAWLYNLISYTGDQMRLGTETDVWLDMFALDYFGESLRRKVNETDTTYRARIKANLFAPKNTVAAVALALYNLTGTEPKIIEPANPQDTGGYGTGEATVWTGLAYNTVGAYGSLQLPFQAFVTVQRPKVQGIPYVGGWYGTGNLTGPGGYGIGAIEYADAEQIGSQVTDDEIYNTIVRTIPAGVIIWTAIVDQLAYPVV